MQPLLEVKVKTEFEVPAEANVWLGFSKLLPVPSPKFQEKYEFNPFVFIWFTKLTESPFALYRKSPVGCLPTTMKAFRFIVEDMPCAFFTVKETL